MMLTKAEKTKQFILETAAPLYNEKGISGVSIDDVLYATKLTKGCLYGHFENKEDLTNQVVDLLFATMTNKIQTAVAKGKTAKSQIFAFMDFYKDPINTYIPGGCPIFNTAVEADDSYPEIREKIASLLRSGQQNLIDILTNGIEKGEFSSKLDPVIFAFKMVAAIEGGLIMCRTLQTVKPMHGLIKDLKKELEGYAP